MIINILTVFYAVTMSFLIVLGFSAMIIELKNEIVSNMKNDIRERNYGEILRDSIAIIIFVPMLSVLSLIIRFVVIGCYSIVLKTHSVTTGSDLYFIFLLVLTVVVRDKIILFVKNNKKQVVYTAITFFMSFGMYQAYLEKTDVDRIAFKTCEKEKSFLTCYDEVITKAENERSK